MKDRTVIAEGGWQEWREELARRFRQPRSSPAFVFYFVAFIIGVGGSGAWISLFRNDREAFFLSLATYFVAILSAAVADLILTKMPKARLDLQRNLQMFALFCLVIGVILAGLSNLPLGGWRYLVGIMGLITALVLWWISNADSEKFFDQDPDPQTTIGGDMKGKPEEVLKGHLEGLTVE